MWCDEARRIGGSAATVLHVQSTKPPFLVASLRGFAAASILNASRLFGSICFSERVIKGDQTLLPSALCQALWSHFNGPEKSSADRIEAKCKGECFICQLLVTGHLLCARRILQKQWFSTSVSSNNLTMWSQGFKLSAPTIWIQIVNFG